MIVSGDSAPAGVVGNHVTVKAAEARRKWRLVFMGVPLPHMVHFMGDDQAESGVHRSLNVVARHMPELQSLAAMGLTSVIVDNLYVLVIRDTYTVSLVRFATRIRANVGIDFPFTGC